MISVKISTNLVRKKDFKNTLCFLWLTSHGTAHLSISTYTFKHALFEYQVRTFLDLFIFIKKKLEQNKRYFDLVKIVRTDKCLYGLFQRTDDCQENDR